MWPTGQYEFRFQPKEGESEDDKPLVAEIDTHWVTFLQLAQQESPVQLREQLERTRDFYLERVRTTLRGEAARQARLHTATTLHWVLSRIDAGGVLVGIVPVSADTKSDS